MPDRLDWDHYFLEIARTTARRSTCDRKHVGCVLVRDRMVLAGGYNGSLRGMAHCDEDGHMMEDGHCVRVVHAEANAVALAARVGISTVKATAYTTTFPCWPCFRLLAQAGIVKVAYADEYRPDGRVLEACAAMGVALFRIKIKEDDDE